MPRSIRKRARTSVKYKEASTDDEDGSDGTHDSGMEEITGTKMAKKRKSIGKGSVKGKGKEKAKEDDDENKMDVDDDASQRLDEAESASKAGSVRGRASKPKSSIAGSTTTPAPKKRARPPKSARRDTVQGDETEPVASASAPPKPRPRKPKAKPKSKAIIDTSSDIEEPRGRKRFPAPSSHVGVHESASMSPERSHRDRPPRTRSLSRSRNTDVRMRVDKMDSSSPTRGSSKPRSKSNLLVSMVSDGSIVPETDEEEKEEKPKKKRKIST